MWLRLPATLTPGRAYGAKAGSTDGAGEMGRIVFAKQPVAQGTLGGQQELLECECRMSNVQ
jgi:hypothetical protein